MVAHVCCIPSECFELRPVGSEPINIFLPLDSQLALLTFASQADCTHLPALTHIITRQKNTSSKELLALPTMNPTSGKMALWPWMKAKMPNE